MGGGRAFFEGELAGRAADLQGRRLPRGRRCKGSWAGGNGAYKFMPFVLPALCRRFHADGKRDIWGARFRVDALASDAAYLKPLAGSRASWRR